MFKSTKQQKKFWVDRKIDWKTQYLDTWNHPHRQLIVWALETIPWISLWEVGCGPGANLAKIVNYFKPTEQKPRQLCGNDINPEAIELAKQTFTNGRFTVSPIEDLFVSDQSVDVTLSDAALIYYSPKDIDKAIKEMIRITRNHLVLCEFHGTNTWERLKLRWKTGYNAYDYRALLEKHGCYDIKIVKIPPQFWDGFPWQPWGTIIIAKVTHI